MANYRAWSEEIGQDEEDGLLIDAWDEEMAACQWAKTYEQRQAEYSIVSGTDMVVTVKDIKSGETSDYTVSGEAVPSYRARKVANTGDTPNGQ
jgi:hypothetical protein